MEDDIINFDDLNFFNVRLAQFFENGRQPNFFENGRWHKFFEIEDNLNILVIGRQPKKDYKKYKKIQHQTNKSTAELLTDYLTKKQPKLYWQTLKNHQP